MSSLKSRAIFFFDVLLLSTIICTVLEYHRHRLRRDGVTCLCVRVDFREIVCYSYGADYPRITCVPLTFFGEGCNTVTGTWRGVGMDGGSWVCSFTGNRDNFDSRFEGNSSRCCIEWFCLVFLDAILLTNKSVFNNIRFNSILFSRQCKKVNLVSQLNFAWNIFNVPNNWTEI